MKSKLIGAAAAFGLALTFAVTGAQTATAPASGAPAAAAAPAGGAAAPAAAGRAGAAGPAAAGRGGGGANFAGQPRIRAMIVTGGCCHDYPTQAGQIMNWMKPLLPIDWTVHNVGGTAMSFVPELYNNPNWFRGYDLVVHNECFTPADNLVSEEYLNNIAAATKAGVPAIVIHCAMHTFRAEPGDTWRNVLGVRSTRHGPAHQFDVKIVAPSHPAMAGLTDWRTPVDELYVIEKTFSNMAPLANATDTDGQTYPVVWAAEGSGARVFGTTMGHGQATFADESFQKTIVGGIRWALNK